MSEHPQGEWKFGGDPYDKRLPIFPASDHDPFAWVDNDDVPKGFGPDTAHRICSSVNACSEIDDVSCIPELLPAMEAALGILSAHDGEVSMAGDAYKVLDAAIDKAKGKSDVS